MCEIPLAHLSNSLTHTERSQLIALSDHQTLSLSIILNIFQYREDPRIGQPKSTEKKKYNQTCFFPFLTPPALTSYNAQEGSAYDSSLLISQVPEHTYFPFATLLCHLWVSEQISQKSFY